MCLLEQSLSACTTGAICQKMHTKVGDLVNWLATMVNICGVKGLATMPEVSWRRLGDGDKSKWLATSTRQSSRRQGACTRQGLGLATMVLVTLAVRNFLLLAMVRCCSAWRRDARRCWRLELDSVRTSATTGLWRLRVVGDLNTAVRTSATTGVGDSVDGDLSLTQSALRRRLVIDDWGGWRLKLAI
jgi:hypothetical protein